MILGNDKLVNVCNVVGEKLPVHMVRPLAVRVVRLDIRTGAKFPTLVKPLGRTNELIR